MGSTRVIPSLALNSTTPNQSIPCLGLGLAPSTPQEVSKVAKEAILNAIELGYRHFDTAALYQTEPFLGEAIADALSSGLISSRSELFITSKLWVCDAHRDRVLPALQTSLRNIGLEYLDLYLIHMPVAVTQPKIYGNLPEKIDVVLMDFKSVWEAMEECQNLGLTKSIGVSNFSCKKLQNLLTFAKIPPAVNQVEMSPVWQQKKLREFCGKHGIIITAYSPLGANGASWGTKEVMNSEVLHQIAARKGKSVAQISLRWIYEQGVSVVVKSFNKNRMKENADIFSWNLTPMELLQINHIPQQRANLALPFIQQNGPYKSVNEFWDGEI